MIFGMINSGKYLNVTQVLYIRSCTSGFVHRALYLGLCASGFFHALLKEAVFDIHYRVRPEFRAAVIGTVQDVK